MDIAVLIKQVPVSNDVSVDPETHALIRSSSEGMINPADLNAIEAAMVLKEQTGGKVAVFTMGPTDAEKALRDAMAWAVMRAVSSQTGALPEEIPLPQPRCWQEALRNTGNST